MEKFRVLEMGFGKGLGALLAVFALSGCTKETIIEKQAPPADIRESIKLSDSELCKNKNCVKLQKSSLDKTFILITSGRTGGLAPQWYDLKPQVVTFSRSGADVAILAENYNTIYDQIKSTHLVQSFPVVTEDATSVTFDLGSGLKSFVAEDSYAIDLPGSKWEPDGSFKSVPVSDSFIQNMKVENSDYFEFNQVAKIITPKIVVVAQNQMATQYSEESIGMNVQIRPYSLSKDFKVKESDASLRVGFFITKVAVKEYSNSSRSYIAKWDISDEKGPITIRISSAVPPEYLEAVKEGAYYWNKVLGKDIVKVVTGVDPNTDPVHRSITIRWLPWLDAGAAYATNQSDPLTGEILRAQVFMPSVFTQVGSADQVRMNGDVPVAVGATRCDFGPKYAELQQAQISNLPRSQRVQLAQDVVRSTVAHELGHAFGLRHNFAASFSSAVTADDVLKASQTFLKDPQSPGLPVATSVMDYLIGIDDYLMSRYILKKPLGYDVMAMKWAYAEDDSALDEKVSLYCSDEHIGVAEGQNLKIYGCERFDSGSNLVDRAFLEAKKEKEIFVKTLFTSILGRLYPPNTQGKADLGAVLAQTQQWMLYKPRFLESLSQMILQTRDNNGRVAPTYISLALLKSGTLFKAAADQDTDFTDRLKADVAAAGGYPYILNTLLSDENGNYNLSWMEAQLQDLMEQPYFTKGTTLGGRSYTLSASEQGMIASFLALAAEQNRAGNFLKQVSVLVPVAGSVTDPRSKAGTYLRAGLMQPSEAPKIKDIYVRLLSSEEFEFNYGPEPRKIAVVGKSLVDEQENLIYRNLLDSNLMNVSLDLAKAQVVAAQTSKVNGLLALIDPTYSLSGAEEWDQWPSRLLNAGLVDQASADFLATEITILKQLVNQPRGTDLK